MKLYLREQKERFEQHLGHLSAKKVMWFDKNALKETETVIKVNTLKPISQIDLNFLFNYKVFPSSILTFKAQWQIENRNIRIGDTIVQQVFIPPLKTFSHKLIFGVRINRVIDESDRKGFSYETLEGHVERGESTFMLEQTEGGLYFKIHTWSEPANTFVKLFGAWAALPYQRYCTRKALENVKRQIEGQTHDTKLRA